MAEKIDDIITLLDKLNSDILMSREEKRVAIQDHIKPMFLDVLREHPKLVNLTWKDFLLFPLLAPGYSDEERAAIVNASNALQTDLQHITVELNEEIFGTTHFIVTREDLENEAV